MKILVFSDSHNHPDLMLSTVRAHLAAPASSGRLDAVFFLGDGIEDFERMQKELPGPRYEAVLGKCDGYRLLEGGSWEKTAECGGLRFLLMHGHRHSVKSGIQRAADYAIARGADVLLYGHTHEAFDEQLNGSAGGSVRVVNPGAVGSWFGASFALIEIRDGQLAVSFGKG